MCTLIGWNSMLFQRTDAQVDDSKLAFQFLPQNLTNLTQI